jgi:DsbC/DsbD-like thiol-disulfide interchange protein
MTMALSLHHRIAATITAALALAVIAAGITEPVAGAPASASPWVASTNSKARFVSGTVELDGKPALMAGVQLRMDSGWKTYWKNPGDSGVPPSFDWSGSKNLKHAELLYPGPHRFADANGTAIGYEDEVVFPVKLTPEREGEPIELKLALEYGLCKDLCIPNNVDLSLSLSPDVGKGDASLIESFLERVPKPAAAGVLPAVTHVEAKLAGDKTELVVEAAFAPNATGTDLFIDAGETFVPVPKALGEPADGKQSFAVTFASADEAAAIKGKTLALTLVSDQGATVSDWTAQ